MAELYAHEDPMREVLRVSVVNEDPAPYPSSFCPGLRTEACTVIHEEPVAVDLNKEARRRHPHHHHHHHRKRNQSDRLSRKEDSRSRSGSPMMPVDGCARTRAYFNERDSLLHVDVNFFSDSYSNSPLLTPTTDSFANT